MNTVLIFWAVLALVLIALETFSPGMLFLWTGFAAAGVWLVLMLGVPMSIMVQVIVFVLLSFISVGVYWKFFRKMNQDSDRPLLNQKGRQMIGKIFVLDTAMVNNQGRIKIGDTIWQVQGENCPQGSLVKVTAIDNGILKVIVVAAEKSPH